MKLLIIDGDSSRQRIVRNILVSLNHKATEMESATDTRTALISLKQKKHDCIIVSMKMPDSDGMALVKEIRAGATTQHIPIVVLSAEPSKDNVLLAHQNGADAFLGYPCSAADVEQALTQALSKKS